MVLRVNGKLVSVADSMACTFCIAVVLLFMLQVASKTPASTDVWWASPMGQHSSLGLSDPIYIVDLFGTHKSGYKEGSPETGRGARSSLKEKKWFVLNKPGSAL